MYSLFIFIDTEHKFKITGSYVRGSLIVETDVCKATLRWNHVNIDHRVKTNYIIKRRSLRNNRWVYDETMLEGNATQYTFSQCILQPGRLYNFYIRSNVLLTNPNETFYVDSSSWDVIMGMYWDIILNVFITYLKCNFNSYNTSIIKVKQTDYFLYKYFIHRSIITWKN